MSLELRDSMESTTIIIKLHDGRVKILEQVSGDVVDSDGEVIEGFRSKVIFISKLMDSIASSSYFAGKTISFKLKELPDDLNLNYPTKPGEIIGLAKDGYMQCTAFGRELPYRYLLAIKDFFREDME